MADKRTSLEEAISRISDGMTIMVGGFGVPGTPFTLLEQLRRHGAKRLTLIKNDANELGSGIDLLLESGQVERLIVSHIGLNPRAVDLMNAGRIEVEFSPQGTLAERIRAAGAGLKAVVTDVGIGTLFETGKASVSVDGRRALIETALHADVALVHAARADLEGNLVYSASARNFNPLMAIAARFVVAESEQIVATGMIDPDVVHTPAPFVDAVVHITRITGAYGVVNRS